MSEDAELLPAIERSAGQRFRSIPELAFIADDLDLTAEDHRALMAEGCHWVAVLEGRIVGFLAAERAGDVLHIAELAVDLPAQGLGLGRALMAAAEAEAHEMGLVALTLTTFEAVPWNGPFYLRLGYEVLPEPPRNSHLGSLLYAERRRDLTGRCAMRKTL